MRHSYFVSLSAISLVACASNPPAAEPAPQPEPQPAPEASGEVWSGDALTDEEKAEQEKAAQLAEDRAQMQGQMQVEMRRWTPELREKAEALSSEKYKDLKSALTKVLASEHRAFGHAERDAMRHPAETLAFFGLTPKMRVIEYLPGEGWYTEILAPTLAAQGKLFVTTTDPEGPKEARETFYGERLKLFLGKSSEAYGKVEPLVIDPKAPRLGLEEPVDMVLVIRGFHGWVRNDSVDVWLDAVHGALKEGGVLGIVQHRAKEGADPKQSAEQGYVPEEWLIEQVEAHGFLLDGKSEINANPKDTKDHPAGVWTLPPAFRLGEQDREKYAEIGESDRMTLRFRKAVKK